MPRGFDGPDKSGVPARSGSPKIYDLRAMITAMETGRLPSQSVPREVPANDVTTELGELDTLAKGVEATGTLLITAKRNFQDLRKHLDSEDTEAYSQCLEGMKRERHTNPHMNAGISQLESLQSQGNATSDKYKEEVDSIISNLEKLSRGAASAKIGLQHMAHCIRMNNEESAREQWNAMQNKRQTNPYLDKAMGKLEHLRVQRELDTIEGMRDLLITAKRNFQDLRKHLDSGDTEACSQCLEGMKRERHTNTYIGNGISELEWLQSQGNATSDQYKEKVDKVLTAYRQGSQWLSRAKIRLEYMAHCIRTNDEVGARKQWDAMQSEKQTNPYLDQVMGRLEGSAVLTR